MKNNKFHIHNSLESLVEYKNKKKQNIKKFVAYLILGAAIYGIVYTCSHTEIKPRGEIYNEVVK